jgi:ankyrin repeat protein
MLITHGANINHKNDIGDSVLSVALRAEQSLIAYCLILKGALIDDRNGIGITALAISARLGNLEFVKVLVTNGASVINVDYFGNTILHHAATSIKVNESCKNFPKENIITFLIQNGANISIKNNINESVLDIANKYGNKDIILMLSEYFKWLEDTYVTKLIDKYILLNYPNKLL